MHDPKFEKEVQQKMAELEFSPSESVWANVDAAINGRRRRRAGMFWRFALPGLLLVAGGAWYFLREAPSKTAVTAVTHAPAANGTSRTSDNNKTSSGTNNSTLGSNKTTPNGTNSTGNSTPAS